MIGRSSKSELQNQKPATLLQEFPKLALLTFMYCLQGVPIGFSTGSLPFLLSQKLTYTQLGIFAIATQPYSFKLAWSPIVDSVFFRSIGRRKSWILPTQVALGGLFVAFAYYTERLVEQAAVIPLTTLFFVIVLLAATQDIAVDGWALTLLDPEYVKAAGTCQTLGMNIGFFTSFTVFLAFNEPSFCNKWIRSVPQEQPIVSISQYLLFWGYVYLGFTLFVALFTTEQEAPRSRATMTAVGMETAQDGQDKQICTKNSTWSEVKGAYADLWHVLWLPGVKWLALQEVIGRLGYQAVEVGTTLVLLGKGVSKELLSGLVFFSFPLDLIATLIAGYLSRNRPLSYLVPFSWVRLAVNAVIPVIIYNYTHVDNPTNGFAGLQTSFIVISALSLVSEYIKISMFTLSSAFNSQVADPSIGGAYITLLSTIYNMGTVPIKPIVLSGIDFATKQQCMGNGGDVLAHACARSKTILPDTACASAGGECVIVRDGYYTVCVGSLLLGVVVCLVNHWLIPKIQSFPLKSWRLRPSAEQDVKQE